MKKNLFLLNRKRTLVDKAVSGLLSKYGANAEEVGVFGARKSP